MSLCIGKVGDIGGGWTLPIQPKEDGSEASEEDLDPTRKGRRLQKVDSAQERMKLN